MLFDFSCWQTVNLYSEGSFLCSQCKMVYVCGFAIVMASENKRWNFFINLFCIAASNGKIQEI
jgi:hypothetical protein